MKTMANQMVHLGNMDAAGINAQRRVRGKYIETYCAFMTTTSRNVIQGKITCMHASLEPYICRQFQDG